MTQMIFVNLPVSDLQQSRAFLEALGAINEPRFTDETAACMTISAFCGSRARIIRPLRCARMPNSAFTFRVFSNAGDF